MQNKKRYLVIADFDDTLFRTSEESPNGINVNTAYQKACNDIFGDGMGEWVVDYRGIKNRTPSEIVHDILTYDNGVIRARAKTNALNFFKNEGATLVELLPEVGKDFSFDLKNPESTIVKLLVGQKLKYLISEIGLEGDTGKIWLQPCTGAVEALNAISRLKQEDIPIDYGIISSGHESFIRKTLEVWGVLGPDVLVTEDDIRPRKYPQELDRRFKPGTFPMALAHHKWIKGQRDNNFSNLVEEGEDSRNRMMYIGDSIDKDFKMAINSSVETKFIFPYTSWNEIGNVLSSRKYSLDGRPFQEVFEGTTLMREGKLSNSERL